jgi:anthranilate phosphoribosyltransferase
MIRDAIKELINGKDLNPDMMKKTMDQIMSGEAAPSQIGAFLVLLRVKGETVDEITQAAVVMREKAVSIKVSPPVLDTCSTGGTGINHFNVSTAVAFVAAGAGIRVAKHGNRALSGRCGSADVLEELGVNVGLSPKGVEKCVNETGIGFLFAPTFHKAMKFAAGPRKELGVRTIFNILGPLTNPASATHQVLGVFDPNLTEDMANVLGNLGLKRAMVVHGSGGMDEISLWGKTRVSELKNGAVRTYEISPGDFGLGGCGIEDIKGGDRQRNAEILRKILNREKSPYRDMVLANSSACFVILEKAPDFRHGVKLAEESIDSGKALEKLKLLIECSNDNSNR